MHHATVSSKILYNTENTIQVQQKIRTKTLQSKYSSRIIDELKQSMEHFFFLLKHASRTADFFQL